LRPLLFRLLLGTAAVALLASCTTTTAGQATSASKDAPDTSSESTTPSDEPDPDELPTNGAPKVDDPLDTAKFVENPCLTLTTDQSQDTFGISPSGQPYDGSLGNACKWKNEESRAQADVRFLDKNPLGLSAEYAVNEEGRWSFFEELTVEGYPAVARAQVDRRSDGICTVVVGASDELSYEVVLQQSRDRVGSKDPCVVAADVASETVKTIKAG
jgi:hypothetical protein